MVVRSLRERNPNRSRSERTTLGREPATPVAGSVPQSAPSAGMLSASASTLPTTRALTCRTISSRSTPV